MGDPFAALGDPTRRLIVGSLARREQSVGELASQLPISRPAVSKHLRILRDAGLVSDRAEGAKRIYKLESAGVEEVRDYLEVVWGDAMRRFKLFAENTSSGS